jgi:predicted secreted hydrolase
MRRRAWLAAPLWAAVAGSWHRTMAFAAKPPDFNVPLTVPSGSPLRFPLQFPRDHGAHLPQRTEWWYATGELITPEGQALGFQITFFRSRVARSTPADETHGGATASTTARTEDPSVAAPRRFEPRHLLFAHGALTDVAAQRQWHAERLARWNGDPLARPAFARLDDTGVAIGHWQLQRQPGPLGGRYRAVLDDTDFGFDLQLDSTQPILLQGDAGYSRKGPEPAQASAYYTQPQLAVSGTVRRGAERLTVRGTAWLDHEWSESLMHPDAVGWDWIGMNLHDGSALTAFQLRRADGSAVWMGGSWRPAGSDRAQVFGPTDVSFTALAHWVSPGSQARYPVRWQVQTPVGRFVVQARMNAQELDSRRSTGTIYWEGLSDLLDADTGVRAGRGYLEMTGYAGRLRL